MKKVATVAIVCCLILLTIFGSVGPWLPGIVKFFESVSEPSVNQQPGICSPSPPNSTFTLSMPVGQCSPSNPGSNPNLAGSDGVPNLSLPKTVVSNFDSLIGAGGVIQSSSQNFTIYNNAVSMRLLGGPFPHDELLAPNGKALSSLSFWNVQANVTGLWVPLVPTTNSLLFLGTNTTGTFVVRTMNVTSGTYQGTLKIVYTATSSGPLKWDLLFVPKTSGTYRAVYSWLNVTHTTQLSGSSKKFRVNYGLDNYTFSWNDIPSILTAVPTTSEGLFTLSVNLGNVSAGSKITVDPSIVSGNVAPGSTAYTFQRKVFYEPKGRNYFVFYYNGTGITAKSSPDGVTWSSAGNLPSGVENCSPNASLCLGSVALFGQQAVFVDGDFLNSYSGTGSVNLHYSIGNVTGATITWGTVNSDTISTTCLAICSSGIRDESVAITPDGYYSFSYNYYNTGTAKTICSGGTLQTNSDSCVLVKYRSNPGHSVFADENDGTNDMRSVLLPADGQGGVRVIAEWHQSSISNAKIQSCYVNSGTGCSGTIDTLDGNMMDTYEFSAVSDSNFGIHLVYRGTDGNATYFYRSGGGSGWNGPSKDIFKGSTNYISITSDSSTNDVYAFGIQGSSIVMRQKSQLQQWSDRTAVYPVTGRPSPTNLGANLASASSTNSSSVLLVWTEGNGPYNAVFASIPIQTVWSPYGAPPDPWNGNGLAPYGQYFANLGEYVSPSTGMLTVEQSDLSVPGRGLNLELTRVYAEPYSFLSSGPYNYESDPWVPIGDGWQLNFPWMNNTQYPTFLHLQDGQGYRIPTSFWLGTTATFENHAGANFRLVRSLSGNIALYFGTGTSYNFDSSHRLTTIREVTSNNTITGATGNNTITFSYTNNLISCITDTVGRAFTFSYSAGFLQTIAQVSGTCSSPGSTMRTISYAQSGPSLISMTDPKGRVTAYAYNATSNTNLAPWLLSRIRYPTAFLTNYTYRGVVLGTQATTFRVNSQITGSAPSSPVRQFSYAYTNPVGDQITNSTVTTVNGTATVSYTLYAFSFLGVTKNVTNASHVLISGNQQIFGVTGEIPKEIVIVSDGLGHIGSYTNYYNYDLWGNRIYTRKVINTSLNQSHETFSSYYGNSEPPGFYAFQDTFSRNQGNSPDNSWNVTNGYWTTSNGLYNGTASTGTVETMVSSSSIMHADLSLQTRLYVGRQTSFDSSDHPRIGIFAHYTGGKYRWSLDLTNESSAGNFLELHDEWYQWLGVNGQPSAKTTCQLTKGAWYTLNMTVRGFSVTGWASTQGQPTCNVSGIFSLSSPAASGVAFGLSAGGYSTLFDDIQVATVSPTITGNGFSNSFFQNGAPGPIGLNTWLSTIKPPGQGWNTTKNWLPSSSWSQAIASQNYGGSPWGTISGWPDSNAQWIWWDNKANASGSADPVWFRRVFNISSTTNINVAIISDNTYVLYLDGTKLGQQLVLSNWQTLGSYTASVGPGYHLLAINATNADGPDPAGLLVSVKNTGSGQVMFRSDATAGDFIQTLAGTAELQNGPFSAPRETYFGYYPWGGLNQTNTRSDPPNPLMLDGTVNSNCANNVSLCSATLTTSQPNDIIVVFAAETLGGGCTFTVSDSAHLTWGSRTNIITARGGADEFQEFYAKSTSALASDTITESISVCGHNYNSLQVIAVSGANFTSPFDPSGVPGTNHADSNSSNTNATITTSNPNDLIFASVQHGTFAVPTSQTGFNGIALFAGYGSEYVIAHGALNSVPVTFGWTTCTNCPWEQIADAIQPGGTTPQTQWLSTTHSYDSYGNPKTQTDPRGNTIYYSFGSNYTYAYLTNQTGLNGALHITTLFAYNFTTGNVRIITDPMGNATSYQNDNLGRVLKTTFPLGAFTQNTFNDPANYVDVTNENQWLTRQIYDGLARQTTIDRFLNGISYSNTTSYYNWQNNVVRQKDALGHTYNYTYDPIGRLTNSTRPDGNRTSIFYNDPLSFIISTDENGNRRCNTYDRLGRLLSVIEYSYQNCSPISLSGNSYLTNYTYDEIGDLLTITNAAGQSILHSYDNLGRISRMNYPDGTIETYGYDNNGNPTSKVDRASLKILSSYDSLNRITAITYCGASTAFTTGTSYTYDKNSNVLSIQNQNATINYIYDARNRTLNETYAANPTSRSIVDLGCFGSGGTLPRSGGIAKTFPVGITYSGELLNSLMYPTVSPYNPDITVKYAYDGLGRALNVTNLATAAYYARSFTYYKNDQIKGFQFGNNLIGNYTYDSVSRPSTISLSGRTTLSLTYGYNKTGTVASVTGAVAGVTVNEAYSYDPLQRLTNSRVQSSGGTTTSSFQYDVLGNQASQTINGTLTSFTYNVTANELVRSSTTGTNITYTYDKDGNLQRKSVTATGKGTVNWNYTWNGSNQLLKVTNGTGQALYAYDGEGRMIEEADSGQTPWFFTYRGTDILYKYLLNTDNYEYVSAAGFRVVMVIDRTSTYYYHSDALGSLRMLTYSDATYVYLNGYRPFGQDNGTSQGAFKTRATEKFVGERWSSATGLYYNYHRWYDPAIGRFISADPRQGSLENPQTLNRYVYVSDSPLNNNDPSGEFINILIGAVAGALIGWAACGLTTGAWFSPTCGEAALVGGATGALAGATFGLSLGAMGVAEVGGASLTEAVGAGAISGFVSGVSTFDLEAFFDPAKATWNNFIEDAAIGTVAGALGGAISKVFGAVKPESLDPRNLGKELAASGANFVSSLNEEAQSVSQDLGLVASPTIKISSTVGKIVIGAGVELGKGLITGVIDPGLKFMATVFSSPTTQSTSQPPVWRDIGNHRG